ncbi:MAG TPA: STAS/SEC14 domain-containing protein [Planctomycetota bacterium]|nr:STAS/SEC14 domain-containing protein [Planctomycetota bacterium]
MTVETRLEAQDRILLVQVSGKLTREDYARFVPVVDAQIELRERVCILFEMRDFHGWTAGALWSDLTFGIKHFTSIHRIAIVGEKSWQKGLAMFCKPFTMARIRYFDAERIEAAREWLGEELGRPANGRPFEFSTAPEPIAALLRKMDLRDGIEREKARHELVAMGSAATAHLLRAAQGGQLQLRLESTRALAVIADPATAEALAALFDDASEIGWAAADGLQKMGVVGAKAVLQQIVHNPRSLGVRVSAHHALRGMQGPELREAVAPVIAALTDSAPVDQAPVAALAALGKLR